MTDFSNLEDLAKTVVDHGFRLHQEVGPGLLESAYEAFLAASLHDTGVRVDRQVSFPAVYRGLMIDNAYRVDLLVERKLIVEIKSVETVNRVHAKQVLTYLRLSGLPLGLLINFGAPLFREAVRRIIDSRNQYGLDARERPAR